MKKYEGIILTFIKMFIVVLVKLAWSMKLQVASLAYNHKIRRPGEGIMS